MYDFLINDALNNVWCTPDQDNSVIVRPGRITPLGGVSDTYNYLWTSITLPEPTSRFHLYQIGQITPVLLKLFNVAETWTTLAAVCNSRVNLIDIYVGSGLQLCRSQTWYMVTKDKNLIIAVKRLPVIKYDFNNDDVFIKVYSNQYFASSREVALNDMVSCAGGVMTNTAAILALQNNFNSKVSLPGQVYAFVNGYKQPTIALTNVNVGDVAEFIYDSSILRTIDFKIDSLGTFNSTLDGKAKYLLHYSSADDATIDYLDDVDLFVFDSVTNKGVYIHKNAADTLRMLSHRDYSIPVAYVNDYFHHFIDATTGVYTIANLYIRMHVKKSGYLRPLVLEEHRINELYKMSDANIQQAMLGVNSTVNVWKADQLESSNYPKVMRSALTEITNDLVRDTYGYNAVAKLAARTPLVVDLIAPVHKVTVPYLAATDSTAFEYDANGLLINWYRHTTGGVYICNNNTAKYVEFIIGEGTIDLDEQYGSASKVSSKSYNYRFYSTPIVASVPTGVWTDISAAGGHLNMNNTITWSLTSSSYSMVRSDKKFLVYRQAVMVTSGLLRFPLTSRQVRDTTTIRNLEVPLGELDVFLNGYSLIEGLDYYHTFPNITIVNKQYLVNPSTQTQDIVIRFTGFCDATLKTTPKNEFGFIQQGRISANSRFDIHDGKVQRIISGGALKVTADLVFSETTNSYNFTSADNGKPYLIRDMVVPLRGLVNAETYAYKALSVVNDKAISDYLTLKLPELAPSTVNPIPSRLTLYSPFICKIITDVISGVLTSPFWSGLYTDMDVRASCAAYEYLLAVDPISTVNKQSVDYVVVHPHYLNTATSLDYPRYRFITRVVELYGNGAINLSAFINII
jgi:hypothetical protein